MQEIHFFFDIMINADYFLWGPSLIGQNSFKGNIYDILVLMELVEVTTTKRDLNSSEAVLSMCKQSLDCSFGFVRYSDPISSN